MWRKGNRAQEEIHLRISLETATVHHNIRIYDRPVPIEKWSCQEPRERFLHLPEGSALARGGGGDMEAEAAVAGLPLNLSIRYTMFLAAFKRFISFGEAVLPPRSVRWYSRAVSAHSPRSLVAGARLSRLANASMSAMSAHLSSFRFFHPIRVVASRLCAIKRSRTDSMRR